MSLLRAGGKTPPLRHCSRFDQHRADTPVVMQPQVPLAYVTPAVDLARIGLWIFWAARAQRRYPSVSPPLPSGAPRTAGITNDS